MSEKTAAGEAHRRVIAFIVRNGSPVSLKPSWYDGWLAGDWKELYGHFGLAGSPEAAHCWPDFGKCTWEDGDWAEFSGTDVAGTDGERHVRGLEAVIWCACGKVAGRGWRYSGTHGDLMRTITEKGF